MVEILNFTICMFYNVFYILEKKKSLHSREYTLLDFFKVGLFKKINKVHLFINKCIKANKQKEILVPHINVERFHFINIYFLLSNNKKA